MNSKYKLLLSNTVIFAIGNILVKLISFFLIPLYTSVLSTGQFGEAELIHSTIEILLPIMTLCIVEALYRFSIDKNTDYKQLFSTVCGVIILGDILVACGCIVFYMFTRYIYMLQFYALFVTIVLYRLTTQFARGLGHSKRFAAYGVINSLILVGSNIIFLVILNGGISHYLLSFSISYGVSAVIAFIFSQEYNYFDLKKYNVSKLGELLKYSLPSVPNMLSWWVNNLSDRYIIFLICGVNTAGLYSVASKLPAMINLITSVFQQAWQYSAAKEIDKKNSTYFFSNIFRVYTYFCVLSCSILIIFNKIICKILLQANFYTAWIFVPVLLLAATFGCIGTYFGVFYNAIKKNKMLMFSTLVGAIVNIILNFILIPLFNGMGAAIATAISFFIIMIIRMIDIKRIISMDINYKKFYVQISLLIIEAIFGSLKGEVFMLSSLIIFILILFTEYSLIKKYVSIFLNIKNKVKYNIK